MFDIVLVLLLALIWISLSLGHLTILNEVKKGNKDQQEIKTRLTWAKKREKKLLKK